MMEKERDSVQKQKRMSANTIEINRLKQELGWVAVSDVTFKLAHEEKKPVATIEKIMPRLMAETLQGLDAEYIAVNRQQFERITVLSP